MVMVISTVQAATGLQEYVYGSWHTVAPPPLGAMDIITCKKKESQRALLSSSLWNVYTRAFASEVG